MSQVYNLPLICGPQHSISIDNFQHILLNFWLFLSSPPCTPTDLGSKHQILKERHFRIFLSCPPVQFVVASCGHFPGALFPIPFMMQVPYFAGSTELPEKKHCLKSHR